MDIRKPIVAGQFYPGTMDGCLAEIQECLSRRTLTQTIDEDIVAGIVPHAGWTFSGALAAMVFSAIKNRNQHVDTFIIFGATHRYLDSNPALYKNGPWQTPLGRIAIDEQMADAVITTGHAVADTRAHSSEHSIEVQIPFIQHLFADAKIVPIVVPPAESAVSLGTAVGDIIAAGHKKVICIGSTDLTHYGPGYGFTPMGTGNTALSWASAVNDRQFIDLALKLDASGLLNNALCSQNACGPGAAAAAVAAAARLGKTKGLLLAHTSSSEVMRRRMRMSSEDSVGYAAIVF